MPELNLGLEPSVLIRSENNMRIAISLNAPRSFAPAPANAYRAAAGIIDLGGALDATR
jgi:hypothetical protein